MRIHLTIPFLFLVQIICCQSYYTHQDTLRGSITPQRAWWSLSSYDLTFDVDIDNKFLSGKNVISFEVLDRSGDMQIDLQAPMKMTGVTFQGRTISFDKDGSAHFLKLPNDLEEGREYTVSIDFEGQPKVSSRPPWDGGLTWAKDKNGRDFIATTVQGAGASLFWPCRDHPADEPETVTISVRVPKGLMDVSNGRLINTVEHEDGDRTFTWQVKNPINNYGVNINIGDYVHFGEEYNGKKGPLTCDYYVLRSNEQKAKKQFEQVSKMLEAFEYWFGPYPFYEDGFKLVEVPYLGMEHQSSVTYGNNFENGYRGMDLSQSGAGLLFDFIIIHEAGHEWFANGITAADNADMWIHESFAAYSENLYLDYHFGREQCEAYVLGTRSRILNDRPIQGIYGVNQRGSGDMYYKGSNMLHTLRHVVNDDNKWREVLNAINNEFRNQTITADQLTSFIDKKVKKYSLEGFFDQYLRDVRIPILEYRLYPGGVEYRWSNCVEDFVIPVDVTINDTPVRLLPTTYWNRLPVEDPSSFLVDRNFYVASLRIY